MILYLTFDGLLQPLGRSQVVRYLEGLAARGWEIAVLSLEREEDLHNVDAVRDMEQRLAASKIHWLRHTYRQGGAVDVMRNIADATAVALDFAADHDVELIHARSYLAGGVALSVKRTLGVPYLFDIRGYWIDERIADGRWFTNSVSLGLGRRLERAMFQGAAGIVCLSQASADDVTSGHFGSYRRQVEVIPTCVDTDLFQIEPPAESIGPELHNRLVIAYVGSIRAAYRVKECFQLVKNVLELTDEAHFLCLTGQKKEANDLADTLRIPRLRRTVTGVPYDQVSEWLHLTDWGLMLSDMTFVKRASMPTKLAEYFATGVRPVVYGCNDDVIDWVKRTGSGLVLDSTSPRALRAAAVQIAELGRRPYTGDTVGVRARDIALEHFSAARGVERYDALYRQLVN